MCARFASAAIAASLLALVAMNVDLNTSNQHWSVMASILCVGTNHAYCSEEAVIVDSPLAMGMRVFAGFEELVYLLVNHLSM